MSDIRPLDPELLFATLNRHRVDYVLIGALGARLYGFPRVTADADIAPQSSQENIDRLAAALRELNAKVFTDGVPEGLPFDCSSAALKRSELWNLVTNAGRLDIAFKPAGTSGFEELANDAERFEVFGLTLRVASLDAIIRSKRAANRPKDVQDVAMLEAIRDRYR